MTERTAFILITIVYQLDMGDSGTVHFMYFMEQGKAGIQKLLQDKMDATAGEQPLGYM